MSTYTQTGPFRYDYAIAGVPFLSAASDEFPYTRQTAQNRREQINTSNEVGEQALDGWWYRSQSSFHMGAGLKYFDTIQTDSASLRFDDSNGVNVWTPGEVSLLRTASRAYTAPRGFAYSFSSEGIGAGNDGYVYADRESNVIYWKNISGGSGSLTFGSGEKVIDATDDGQYIYALTSSGIYRIKDIDKSTRAVDTPNPLYTRSSTSRGRIAFLKDHLVVIADRQVYFLGTNVASTTTLANFGDTDASKIAATYQMPEGFRGLFLADGPNAIYMLAASEETSFVYAFTLSNQGDTPTLNTPTTVVESPRGERFLSMISYIGTYLVLGSTMGVRVGIIAGDTSIVMGPLTVKSDDPVRALFAMGDFVWAGGAKCDGKYGLYRVNLATPLDADALLFPYAKDIATDLTWTGSSDDYIQSITRFGKSDRIVFSLRRDPATTASAGVWEEGTTYLTSGWLRTGRVRMDTGQPKVFHALTITAGGADGTVATQHLDEADTETALATSTFTGTGFQSREIAAAPSATAKAWAQYRFVLNQTGAGTFKFSSYQLRVNPAQVKRRVIQVPLLCMSNEVAPGGRIITRSVFDRIEALEKAQESGAPVMFQDFITGETRPVLIEEIQFIARSIPEGPKQRANYGGVLLVSLRSTEATDSAFIVPGVGPTASTLNPGSLLSAQGSDSAIDTYPRYGTLSTNGVSANGEVRLTYFTPLVDLEVTGITVVTGATAQAGASLVRMGLYTVDPATNLITLVARTANDTSICASANTAHRRVFNTAGGYPASYKLVAGSRYAVGLIVVGASTTPTLHTAGTGTALLGITPRMNGLLTSQTDLPVSATPSTAGSLHWFRLS